MNSVYILIPLVAALLQFTPQEVSAQTLSGPSMFEVVDSYWNRKTPPSAVLKIVVVDENQKPIPGAEIFLRRRDNGDRQALKATDTFGNTMGSVPRSEYEVQVKRNGYQATRKSVVLNRGLKETIILKTLPDSESRAESKGERLPASVPAAEEDLDL